MRKTKGRALSVPNHVALIPDGNRRWSRENGTKIFSAYNMGIKKFVDFSVWLKAFGVKNLTVWALSTENIARREGAELNVLYNLYVKASKDPEIMGKLDANKATIRVIGRLEMLPKRVRDALLSVERRTKDYKDFTINLLIAYGGRYDMLAAVNGVRSESAGHRVSEEDFRSHLLTSEVPDADMIIRTSGESRLSGFLPWQSSYSELYFSKKYWPDFSRRDLARAIRSFSSRQRRFGS
jgi:tritrans,polycis-undecaprenyl-diphosphate synthase [geranylgeranyl-diphosphate specific]